MRSLHLELDSTNVDKENVNCSRLALQLLMIYKGKRFCKEQHKSTIVDTLGYGMRGFSLSASMCQTTRQEEEIQTDISLAMEPLRKKGVMVSPDQEYNIERRTRFMRFGLLIIFHFDYRVTQKWIGVNFPLIPIIAI